jgi:hypothetical protein
MLYLRGTDDRLVPDAAWRRMAAERPITTLHVPGPHLLLQANPIGAWAEAVRCADGLEVTSRPLPGFPQGLLIMMNSSARDFLLYDRRCTRDTRD